MKKVIQLVLFITLVIVLTTGCQVVRKAFFDFSIRMTAEQIRQGSFTGGRLIFSENDVNQLEAGNLIPILNKTSGFVPVDGGETYEFQTLDEKYGYYYVVASNGDSLTLDYLLYDADGKILEHEEGIVVRAGELLNRNGTKITTDSVDDTHYHLSYSKLQTRDGIGSRELQGVSLLSFPNDIPNEDEQTYFDTDKKYRTVLFRLQESGTQPYAYTSGVIAAHETEPFLVIDSAFYDETRVSEDAIEINDPNLPMVEIGDYILDSSTSTARKVTGLTVGNDPEGFQIFQTEGIHLQKAVSAMRVQVEGDIGEMIQRYGTTEQKERLHDLLSSRSDYNIWDTQATASLWKDDGPVELELDYNIHLGANMSFTSDVTWDRVSASGSFSIDTRNNLDLIFELLGVDPGTEKKGTFIKVPLKIPIEKFTLGVTLKVVADYESEESTSTLRYEADMDTGNCELGVTYDVGAKLTFIWGFIPVPQAWCNCHEIYDPFSGASFNFEGTELKEVKENTLNIGLGALFELNLFGAITFNLDANLGICTEFVYKPLQDYDWWADVGVYGSLDHLKFGVGVPFTSIGYTWDFGTLLSIDPDGDGHIVSIPLDDLMNE